jgi:hypothetical protein
MEAHLAPKGERSLLVACAVFLGGAVVGRNGPFAAPLGSGGAGPEAVVVSATAMLTRSDRTP